MATIELVDLHHPNRTCRVRLWGLDVFTVGGIDQDGGVATNRTEAVAFNLLPNQIVRLHVQSHRMLDEDGNLLGYVELPNGTWLNERLLSSGLVQVEHRYDHRRARRFELLEQQARMDGIGGWQVP